MSATYLITGASGKLGSKVVDQLLAHGVGPASIVALVRSEDKGQAIKAKGVQIRIGNYDDKESLQRAVKGITHAFLVSGHDMGKRVTQHKNFVEAVKQVGPSFKLLTYTSHLYAKTSPALLAADHKETEEAIEQSGVPYSMLRNGWYIENTAAQIGVWNKTGVIVGATGQGRVSAASINDYAEAAVKVMTSTGPTKKIYELGGHPGYTLDELASIASDVLGKPIKAVHQSKAEYASTLASVGLPPAFANVLADAEDNASRASLLDDTHDLETLIGRPSESVIDVMKSFL